MAFDVWMLSNFLRCIIIGIKILPIYDFELLSGHGKNNLCKWDSDFSPRINQKIMAQQNKYILSELCVFEQLSAYGPHGYAFD